MKAELELHVDATGKPIIKIKHRDKSDSLEQKMLGIFVKEALENGCMIVPEGGFVEVGTCNSWENYEIHIKNPHEDTKDKAT